MGIQWTLVASFLYAEIAVAILLMIPCISPKSWNEVFQSRFIKRFEAHAENYFKVMMVVLGLLFFDSLREMLKYSTQRGEAKAESHDHGNVYMQLSIQMFRSQRNSYVAGFSLFLWLVIHRLVTLIRNQAVLLAISEATHAQPATGAAQSILKKSGESAKQKSESNIKAEKLEKQVLEPETEYERARKDVDHVIQDLDAMSLHSENLGEEYGRLCDEHAEIPQMVAAGADDKKDK